MKIGIMSFAHLHAEAYVHNVRSIPGVEFIGFADDDAERGRHFAQLFDAVHRKVVTFFRDLAKYSLAPRIPGVEAVADDE